MSAIDDVPAVRDINGHPFTRVPTSAVYTLWECSKDCGEEACVSPLSLEEVGTPMCNACDEPMTYVCTYVRNYLLAGAT